MMRFRVVLQGFAVGLASLGIGGALLYPPIQEWSYGVITSIYSFIVRGFSMQESQQVAMYEALYPVHEAAMTIAGLFFLVVAALTFWTLAWIHYAAVMGERDQLGDLEGSDQ